MYGEDEEMYDAGDRGQRGADGDYLESSGRPPA